MIGQEKEILDSRISDNLRRRNSVSVDPVRRFKRRPLVRFDGTSQIEIRGGDPNLSVPEELREKDREVHSRMKKDSVSLGTSPEGRMNSTMQEDMKRGISGQVSINPDLDHLKRTSIPVPNYQTDVKSTYFGFNRPFKVDLNTLRQNKDLIQKYKE